MARRCKHFYYSRWWCTSLNEMRGCYCCKIGCIKILDTRCKGCDKYEVQELNPDWKDIIEEFNRRLSNDR